MKKTKQKLSKSIFCVFFICSFNCDTIFADLDQRITDLEKKIEAITTITPAGQLSINTSSYLSDIPKGLFLTADILYWHTKLGGTEFAYTEENSFTDTPIKGSLKEHRFDWDFGFRFGAGYRIDHDDWELFFNYTYFNTTDSSKESLGDLGLIIPLRANYAIVGSLTEAATDFVYCKNVSSQIGISYDDLDFSVGRNYYISRFLSLNPYFGVKSSWLDIDQVTRYSGGFIIQNNTVNVLERSDFWGMGPEIGFSGKWYIYNGFSFIENLEAALLFGYFKVKHHEYYSLDPADKQIKLSADMHRFSPFFRILIGLAYDQTFDRKRQHIGISLGYEVNYYFRINQSLYDFNFTTSGDKSKYTRFSEDLSFYGLTLNFRWDF